MKQRYEVIESSIIDSMQSLDNIFSNDFCKVGTSQQEKVIKSRSRAKNTTQPSPTQVFVSR